MNAKRFSVRFLKKSRSFTVHFPQKTKRYNGVTGRTWSASTAPRSTSSEKKSSPLRSASFTNFLSHWQHRHPSTQESGEAGLLSVLEKMEGYALHSELWESEILRHRMKNYDPGVLRALSTKGEIVCAGSAPGKSQWIFSGDGACFLEEKEKLLEGVSTTGKRIVRVSET